MQILYVKADRRINTCIRFCLESWEFALVCVDCGIEMMPRRCRSLRTDGETPSICRLVRLKKPSVVANRGFLQLSKAGAGARSTAGDRWRDEPGTVNF